MRKRWIHIKKLALLCLCFLFTGCAFFVKGIPNSKDSEDANLSPIETVTERVETEALVWDVGQRIQIDISNYYGDYRVGAMVGDGYIYDDIDPNNQIMGGILSLSLDQARFDGPAGSIVLDNPKYVAFLELPYDFSGTWRGAYSSFEFHNAYIVRVDIYDGDDLWMPFGIGPIWLKDWNTLVIRHHAYHELTRTPFDN